MNILAIETSTIAASAAVMTSEKLCSLMYADYKLKHSEKLMPLIDAALSQAHMNISEIDCFAASSGPGSFTGLRIGAACVKGFAQATGKPIVGIGTLEAAAFANRTEELIVPILDAQRNEVYAAVYAAEGFIQLVSDSAIALTKLADTIEGMTKYTGGMLFCGDAVNKYRDILTSRFGTRARFAPKYSMMPNAAAIAELALLRAENGETVSCEAFLPNYLRASQPEEAKKNG